ncbi:MAG: DNA repair protein RadA [Clostridiales bacterium]|jgi:DNA repair protein RadA/Sms|nr:DNA repair protein RadA [Clostridiales bacterium]
MAKQRHLYVCSACGYETSGWLGKCPSCGAFGTLEESEVPTVQARPAAQTLPRGPEAFAALRDVAVTDDTRLRTGIGELDRVLCGGIVEGSLVLIGGDPGIGKSTIILQICQNIGQKGNKILYVSGEESVRQVKLRAERLGVTTGNLLLLSETSLEGVEQAVRQSSPRMLIVDSIQTIYRAEMASAPGSVTQVRECTAAFIRLAKGLNISVIIVGHVTKEGAIAGPRVLEHMVDTVLYFEGERGESYRLIRAVKNRFGGTNEIGVFEMRENGLAEITNPSEYMLAGRPINASGSVVTCTVEGTRPILAEVQALVAPTGFGMPRRMASGMDFNRVIMLIAVLEKKAGFQIAGYDSYVNVAGGMKISEPAADAAVVAAVASSFKNKALEPHTVILGEIGLAGEMRAVTMAERRVAEARKLGFTQCVLPQANLKGLRGVEGVRVFGAANVREMLQVVMM